MNRSPIFICILACLFTSHAGAQLQINNDPSGTWYSDSYCGRSVVNLDSPSIVQESEFSGLSTLPHGSGSIEPQDESDFTNSEDNCIQVEVAAQSLKDPEAVVDELAHRAQKMILSYSDDYDGVFLGLGDESFMAVVILDVSGSVPRPPPLISVTYGQGLCKRLIGIDDIPGDVPEIYAKVFRKYWPEHHDVITMKTTGGRADKVINGFFPDDIVVALAQLSSEIVGKSSIRMVPGKVKQSNYSESYCSISLASKEHFDLVRGHQLASPNWNKYHMIEQNCQDWAKNVRFEKNLFENYIDK